MTETEPHSDVDDKQDASAEDDDSAASSSENAKDREAEMEESGEENAA
jgi:hypothetical protein